MGIILSKLKPKATAKVQPFTPAVRGEERRRLETVRVAPLNTEQAIHSEELAGRRRRLRRMGYHELFAPIAEVEPDPRLPFEPVTPRQSVEGSLAKGGKIKKTGLYKLHAGELVVKKERVSAVKKAVKSAKMKPLKE